MQYDVVVLGAGAAGMMCAFEAGKRGRRVLLLEHGERVGRKILISGGGRCNFTNVRTKAENFLSENPHFAKSALARFTPRDFIALVEKHRIKYHEKTLGQLFCDDSAKQIVAMLERECAEASVDTRCGVTVRSVRRAQASDASPGAPDASQARFVVETSAGNFACASVVVAAGGLSIPAMGATGFGYDLAREFGHTIVEPRAGLVPLVFSVADREHWCDLAGVAFEVVARAQATVEAAAKARGKAPVFREALLVTHRGVSGPAVLQVSSYWRPGGEVSFDMVPGVEVFQPLLARASGRDWSSAYAALRTVLPTRMAERWVRLRANENPGDWTNAGIARLESELHAWTLRPDGSEGFAKAEVTVGGVDTRELDARTMESQRVAGLYFIGEVVDVTGWLGGYNFQWAWASAAAAGAAA
ncbi:MAG: NAD(P)/FAD-dependent oxidoreductase [Burkholderiales bacterium]|nr:NAD(P)/FAD-dependent oxidoreductase [Burkholderiales bacterium]